VFAVFDPCARLLCIEFLRAKCIFSLALTACTQKVCSDGLDTPALLPTPGGSEPQSGADFTLFSIGANLIPFFTASACSHKGEEEQETT
jgi:hypothetical protein